MRLSCLARVALGVGLTLVGAATAHAQQPALPSPAQSVPSAQATAPTAPESFPAVTVTDEMRSHQRWVDALYFAGTAYGLLVLLAVLALGLSRRMRDLAVRVTRRPFLAAMIYFVLFAVLTTLLSLPMDWLSGFHVPHRFGLSDQSLPAWLWDQTKGLLVGIVVGAPIAALALTGIRRIRRWWLALWLGSVPIMVFLILIGPVLLDPVFNKFEPLKDTQLRDEILTIASRAGITGGRVFQVDKSKQTKEMNAYVNGLGPTKRIVLWDTTLAKLQHDEIGFVMAHEMGHYVLHHVWKLLGILVGLFLVVFWIAQRAVEAATRRWGSTWGFEAAHDPAALPVLMLVISLVMFLLTPLVNGISRHFEHQADVFALELTRANHSGASAFVKLAEDSKVLPDPHPFIRFWRYSHPTLAERIEFCRVYKPWAQGQSNRVWQGGGT